MSQFRYLLRPATLLLLGSLTAAASATDLELVCPCTVASDHAGAVRMTGAIANRDSVVSGPVRVVLRGHEQPISNSFGFNLGEVVLDAPIEAGATAAQSGFVVGYDDPPEGVYYYSIVLQELKDGDWEWIDTARMDATIALDGIGAGSRDGSVYYADGVTASFTDTQVAIDLPSIVNNGPDSTGNLSIQVRQTNDQDLGSFFIVAETDLAVSLGAGQQTAPMSLDLPFDQAHNAAYIYYFVVVLAGTTRVAWHPVRSDGEPFPERSFAQQHVDLLTDSDGDGASDYNETTYALTNPDDASEAPGISRVGVAMLYSQGVAAVADPATRAVHLIESANQMLADSDVQIALELVHLEARTMDETVTNQALLDQMDDDSGPFSGLETLRTEVGADLVVALRPFPEGSSNCGFANVLGKGEDGLIHDPTDANTAMFIDCRDRTMIHEIGHILGLRHSREQVRAGGQSWGTFRWSLGYGVNDSFVTIMADDFGDTTDINVFSSPRTTCMGVPCGIDESDIGNGANAALSLNAVRFQAALLQVGSGQVDTDGDGLVNAVDPDDDNDGVPDTQDVFPLDAAEWSDCDADGVGDNADDDWDCDGVMNAQDVFPFDPTESSDLDGDGIGDNADPDDDNDGLPDATDPNPNVASGRLANIATRGFVGTGDNVLIGGTIITGSSPKTVIIRARGPSLARFGVAGTIADPTLELYDQAGTIIGVNDSWQTDAGQATLGTLAPSDPLEAAITMTLAPGAYTAIVRGAGASSGIGIVEVFEQNANDEPRLANIATRGFVGVGDNVLIGGMIIGGAEPQTVLIRARGPSLAAFGVAGTLANPVLHLYDVAGQIIDQNDDWQDHPDSASINPDFAPSDPTEAAILKTLTPGAYTAIVHGSDGTEGVGIVEVFAQ